MSNLEQRLIEAAARYHTQLEAGQPMPFEQLAVEPAVQTELGEMVEAMLALGQPPEPVAPTAEELAIAKHVSARVAKRLAQRLAPAPRRLHELRAALRLSPAALARLVNLPVDLLARIERGGVLAPTLPETLVARLAQALHVAEAEIRAALAVGPLPLSVRLNARNGTQTQSEAPVTFDQALRASAATAQQRAEWLQ